MFGRKRKSIIKEEEVILFENQPKGTVDIVRLEDIRIPPVFSGSPPKQRKLEKCQSAYYRLKHLDKPITVIAETNENGKPNTFILVDGYIRYLWAKIIKLYRVPVRYMDINTYIESK